MYERDYTRFSRQKQCDLPDEASTASAFLCKDSSSVERPISLQYQCYVSYRPHAPLDDVMNTDTTATCTANIYCSDGGYVSHGQQGQQWI